MIGYLGGENTGKLPIPAKCYNRISNARMEQASGDTAVGQRLRPYLPSFPFIDFPGGTALFVLVNGQNFVIGQQDEGEIVELAEVHFIEPDLFCWEEIIAGGKAGGH
jgi:hypothetical protein